MRSTLALAVLLLTGSGVGCGMLRHAAPLAVRYALTPSEEVHESISKAELDALDEESFVVPASATHVLSEETLARAIDEWGDRYLQEGDIVCRLGRTPFLGGIYDLSEYSARMTNSRYTHCGFVIRDGGRVYVREVNRPDGQTRTRLSEFTMKFGLACGILRPKAEYAAYIPLARQYIDDVELRDVPFDDRFKQGEEKLYCAELVEYAYRSAGVPLADPVKIRNMPGYADMRTATMMIRCYTWLSPEQELFIPGNARIGLWSSPVLQSEGEFTSARQLALHAMQQLCGDVHAAADSVDF